MKTLLMALLLSGSACGQDTAWKGSYATHHVHFYPSIMDDSFSEHNRSFTVHLVQAGVNRFLEIQSFKDSAVKRFKLGNLLRRLPGRVSWVMTEEVSGNEGLITLAYKDDKLMSLSVSNGLQFYIFKISYPEVL